MITKERDEELKAMAEMRMKASEPHPYMRALVQKRIEGTITPLEDEALDRFYETEGMSGGFTPFFLNSEQEFERIRYHEARFANEALFKELRERKAGTIQKKTQLTDEEFFKLYGMTREEATAQDKFEDECFNDMFEQEEQERLADTTAILLAEKISKRLPFIPQPATEPTATPDPKKEPCPVCGWRHDSKLTRFENPKNKAEFYTVKDGCDRHSFFVYLHGGMVDSGDDVSLKEYMEKMRDDGKRPVDILGKDLFSKLFMSTATDRAKIRPPDFKRTAGRPQKKT